MDTDIISVNTEGRPEDVAQLLLKSRDFLPRRWWTRENRLVGIVTVDDAVEVIEQGDYRGL